MALICLYFCGLYNFIAKLSQSPNSTELINFENGGDNHTNSKIAILRRSNLFSPEHCSKGISFDKKLFSQRVNCSSKRWAILFPWKWSKGGHWIIFSTFLAGWNLIILLGYYMFLVAEQLYKPYCLSVCLFVCLSQIWRSDNITMNIRGPIAMIFPIPCTITVPMMVTIPRLVTIPNIVAVP